MTRADAARGVRIGVEECVFRVLPSFVSRRVARAVYYRSTTRARSRIPSACTEIFRRRGEFEPTPRRNYFEASFETSSSSSVPAAAPGRVVVVHAGVSSEIRADLDASAAVSNVSPPAFGSARRRSAAARLGGDDSDNRPVFLGAPPRRIAPRLVGVGLGGGAPHSSRTGPSSRFGGRHRRVVLGAGSRDTNRRDAGCTPVGDRRRCSHRRRAPPPRREYSPSPSPRKPPFKPPFGDAAPSAPSRRASDARSDASSRLRRDPNEGRSVRPSANRPASSRSRALRERDAAPVSRLCASSRLSDARSFASSVDNDVGAPPGSARMRLTKRSPRGARPPPPPPRSSLAARPSGVSANRTRAELNPRRPCGVTALARGVTDGGGAGANPSSSSHRASSHPPPSRSADASK